MMIYNFDRIFKARGILRPFAYLKKSGFSDNFASRINKNKVASIRLIELEKLCIMLRCTPNDLLEWVPDNDIEVDKDHPIYTIRKSDKVVDITKTLNSIPLNKLEEIDQFIKDKFQIKS